MLSSDSLSPPSNGQVKLKLNAGQLNDGQLNGGQLNGGGVAEITFGHPKANSLPSSLLRQLAQRFDEVAHNPTINSILFRSEGVKTFCAGASFDELQTLRTENEATSFFLDIVKVILAMVRTPQPIITLVQGKAVGGGVGLIAASDYVFAGSDSQVRLSEYEVGIGPFIIGPAIERAVGPSNFRAMALDTEWRDAAWCLQHGLFHKVVGSFDELQKQGAAFAATIAQRRPDATDAIKRMLTCGTEDWQFLLSARAATSGRLWATKPS